MKIILLSCTAALGAFVAAPAAAQYYPDNNQSYYSGSNSHANDNLSMHIGRLQARLDDGIRSGSITRREATPIRRQISQLYSLERQYRATGMSGQDRAMFQQRIRTVRQALRRADDGAQGRYSQWDREENQWDYRADGRIGANRDGWDERDHDRDGRWDNGSNYGYQTQPAQPGGIAGIINSVLGGGVLRAGQPAPANLYGVPYQYQGQYRDGNGVYYRSDGRSIYQIDARTRTVIRAFPM